MLPKQATEEKDPGKKASVSPSDVSDDEAAERERRDVLLRNGVVPEDFARFLAVFKKWRAKPRA
jgi:hypothetical protein